MLLEPKKGLTRQIKPGGTPTIVKSVQPATGVLRPVNAGRPTLTISPAKAQMRTTLRFIEYLRKLGATINDPVDNSIFDNVQHTARLVDVPKRLWLSDDLMSLPLRMGYSARCYFFATAESKTRQSVTFTYQDTPRATSDPRSIHLDAVKECVTFMY